MSEAVATPAASRAAWKWMTLADVGKVITGNTPPTADAENYGDAIPFVKPTELVDRGIRSAPSGLAPQAMGKARVVPAGAVLVSCIGNLGKTGIAKVPVAFNQQINAVVFNENVIPEFGFYYAQTLKPWLYGESSATTIPIVNKGKFQQARFPLAPLDEQREIVAELEKQFSRLDEAVANLQRVKANLKRYKASVLKAAVEGRLVETEATLSRREGRTYETGEQVLQRILAERRAKWIGKGKYREPIAPLTEELPELPEGWTWATMPQLGELNRGKSKHRPRDDQALYGGPYPFIQTGDVRRSDGSITGFTQTYSELGLSQSRLWPPGTLCITIAANIAETGILKMKACFPDSVVGFIPQQGSPTVEYVECFIRTARDQLDRFASATAQKNINLEVLEAVAIPVPPLAEQARIVAEVDRHLSIIREVEAEVDANLQRAQALRQATLARAFSGTSAA